MISLDEARQRLLSAIAPLGPEQAALGDAHDRILAADVIAPFDQPALPMSAMDGFAVRSADAVPGARLHLIGSAYAGTPFDASVTPGTAVRIATGGVVPDGAGRVIMQEFVTRDGDHIILGDPLHKEHFVRPAGGDFHAGEILLRAGQRLTAARLGLAAAANCATLSVRRRPRIALFASGDELRDPGAALAPGQVLNSAAPAIAALVIGWGGEALRQPILPDDRAHCRRTIAAARDDHDLLLFIGGASVGDKDVLRDAVADLGGEILFDRIAVQPGKPSWCARFADGRLALGLPGNPASAFVCAHLLLEPLIAAFLGRASRMTPRAAILRDALPANGPRETYWRAVAALDPAGRLVVALDPRRDSSLQLPLASANALVRQPASSARAEPGAIVELLVIGDGLQFTD